MDYKPYTFAIKPFAKGLASAPDEEILELYWSSIKTEEESRQDMDDKIYPRGGRKALQRVIEFAIAQKTMYLTTLLLRGRTDLLEKIDERSITMC